MTDIYTKKQRSCIMRKVKSSDTHVELFVRKLLKDLRYKFEVNTKNLLGQPDIVFQRRKKVIFVHGCFWHQHPRCKASARPTSNCAFWNKKLNCNVARDNRVTRELHKMKWNILTIWECQIKRKDLIKKRIIKFIQS